MHLYMTGKGAKIILVDTIDEDTDGTGFSTTVVFNGFKKTAEATKASNKLHLYLL